MIQSFLNQGTADIFDGKDTAAARKVCPSNLVDVARRKLDLVNRAVHVSDLRIPPGNRLEKLKRDREGAWSIRINDQYRVCFRWDRGAHDVEITDYH